jgi:hypothetical protein
MVVRRVGIFSLGKVLGFIYGLVGLVVGTLFTLLTLAGARAAGGDAGALAAAFTVGAIVILPILYGMGGFFAGLVFAVLYNLVAAIVGGVELELERRE